MGIRSILRLRNDIIWKCLRGNKTDTVTEATQKMQAFDTVGLGPIHVECGMEFSTDFQEVNKRRLLAEDINIASHVGVVILVIILSSFVFIDFS